MDGAIEGEMSTRCEGGMDEEMEKEMEMRGKAREWEDG